MLKLGIVADPLINFKVKKDSTLAMMQEVQKRRWPLYIMEQKDLTIKNGIAYASMCQVKINLEKSPWFEIISTETKPLTELDVILMRKDPPFDIEYIYTTYILELAEKQGVLVANKPQSLRDCNEKIFACEFPQCCPPTLVSRNIDDFKNFLALHHSVVFKPLDSMGGKSIFFVTKDDININVILETQSALGTRYFMAQKFIPEIKNGDKRILLIDGKPIPYGLARIPKSGDIRGNLAAGGSGVGVELNERDYWICDQIAPTLRKKGLIFVGIDVIGDYLTEINVTCPTCIREIEAAFPVKISEQFMNTIEESLLYHRKG